MRARSGRALRLILVAVTLALLAIFAARLDWTGLWTSARKASPPLLAAAALVHLLSVLLKAVRWWVFLRPIGARSLPLAIRATVAGAGLNNLLVANGGEAARVLFVAREAQSPVERVVATLAVERLFEIVGFALVLAGAALFVDLPPTLVGLRPWALAGVVVVALAVGWLIRRRPHDASPAQSASARRPAERLRRFWETMAGVCTRRRAVAALALTVGVWTLQLATYHLTAQATRLDIPVSGTVAALLLANLGFAVRATPGGVGLFQALYVAGAATAGVDPREALVTALLLQAQQVLPVTGLCLLLAPHFLLRRSRPGDGVPVAAASAS